MPKSVDLSRYRILAIFNTDAAQARVEAVQALNSPGIGRPRPKKSLVLDRSRLKKGVGLSRTRDNGAEEEIPGRTRPNEADVSRPRFNKNNKGEQQIQGASEHVRSRTTYMERPNERLEQGGEASYTEEENQRLKISRLRPTT